MRCFVRCICLIGLLLQANLLWADIYQSTDKLGQTVFSDKPTANAQKITTSPLPYRYRHHVAKVYDGDTIRLSNGDKVRLLGINTPEIESHFQQAQVGGQSAKNWLSQKLSNHDVMLEYDVEKRDKYDRLLAHIYLDDEHINKSLLAQGLATLVVIPPNIKYSEELIAAQNEAMIERLGLWSLGSYQPTVISPQHSVTLKKGWQRLIVKPQRLTKSRKYVRLQLAKNLTLRFKKSSLDLFPDLSSWLDKTIEVRGWASRKEKTYSILIHHPSAITVLK
jgi:micrococcal nuclease